MKLAFQENMFNLFNSKKLKKHPTISESSPNLEVSLILADGRLLTGDLVDINISEAVVSFSSEKHSNFTLNEKVQLRLRAAETQKTLFIKAIIKDLRIDTGNGAK